MQKSTIALVVLACLVGSPIVDAKPGDGDGQGKGKGKGKKGKKGKGDGGGGHVTAITGAGQRLHFTFGGRMLLQGDKLTGNFVIISHPLAPASTTRLSISCRFQEFTNVALTGPKVVFDGTGNCGVLNLDGKLEKIQVSSHFEIIDNSGGHGIDNIDVEFIGDSGIMIPGGNLEFGDFTFKTS